MNIIKDHYETITRKSLAILSLPIVTRQWTSSQCPIWSRGKPWSIFVVSITSRAQSQSTLLNSSTLVCQRSFLKIYRVFGVCAGVILSSDSMIGPLLCYYIDGNTKALWSSSRVKKNKVTMLGRVMGCLEQVFIHDGLGHPIYFETYSGQGPTGEKILGLFEKIESTILEVPRSRTRNFQSHRHGRGEQ